VFQQRLTDTALLGELAPELERANALNAQVQLLLRQWHQRGGHGNPADMLDQGRLDWFHRLNAGLHEALDEAGVRARLRSNIALLETLAGKIRARCGVDGGIDGPLDLFDRAA
jgi:hypothetical protein